MDNNCAICFGGANGTKYGAPVRALTTHGTVVCRVEFLGTCHVGTAKAGWGTYDSDEVGAGEAVSAKT